MQHFLGVILLVKVAASLSILHEDQTNATSRVFRDCSTNYTSQHDIFSLTLPITKKGRDLRFDVDVLKPHMKLFFVEADVNDKGEKDYKGLYVLIDNEATKLLDQGTDVATSIDSTAAVYFSAKDGLYIYNETEEKADKYGNITDSIISVEKVNGSDILYILTEAHDLYKVINHGHKKIKIHKVKKARQIILDFSNNLYYYGADKKFYVMNARGKVLIIDGLPENPTRVNMFRTPFGIPNSVFLIIDDKTYMVSANGTVSTEPAVKLFQFQVVPTSSAMEGSLLQYYAYDKKICLYNSLQVWIRKIVRYLLKNWFKKESLIPKSTEDFFYAVSEL